MSTGWPQHSQIKGCTESTVQPFTAAPPALTLSLARARTVKLHALCLLSPGNCIRPHFAKTAISPLAHIWHGVKHMPWQNPPWCYLRLSERTLTAPLTRDSRGTCGPHRRSCVALTPPTTLCPPAAQAHPPHTPPNRQKKALQRDPHNQHLARPTSIGTQVAGTHPAALARPS